MERKMERQRVTRDFIVEFKRKREEWKAMERQRMEDENRRIKEYAKTQEKREEVAKAEKRAREQAMDKVQRALADQIKRDREDREEQELVRQELYLEEQEQAIRRRERDEMEARIRQRLELQRERDEQLQFKRVRDVEVKQEEERYRQQVSGSRTNFVSNEALSFASWWRNLLKMIASNKWMLKNVVWNKWNINEPWMVCLTNDDVKWSLIKCVLLVASRRSFWFTRLLLATWSGWTRGRWTCGTNPQRNHRRRTY